MNAVRFLEVVATANSKGANPIQASHHKSKFGNVRTSRTADEDTNPNSRSEGALSRIDVRKSGRRLWIGDSAASTSLMRRSLAEHSNVRRLLAYPALEGRAARLTVEDFWKVILGKLVGEK